MRVITAALPVADTPSQLFGSCDVEATACLVVHKALATAAERGASEARQMLCDWLALLTAAVTQHRCGSSQGQVSGALCNLCAPRRAAGTLWHMSVMAGLAQLIGGQGQT